MVRTSYRKKKNDFRLRTGSSFVKLGLGIHHGTNVIMGTLKQVRIFRMADQQGGAILMRMSMILIGTRGMQAVISSFSISRYGVINRYAMYRERLKRANNMND